MRWSTNKRLHLEMGLIQAVHSLAEANISDIIRALNGAPLPETPIATTQLPSVAIAPAPQPAHSAPVAAPAPAPMPEPEFAPAPAPEPEPAPMPAGLEPIDDAPPSFELNAELKDAPPLFDEEPAGMYAGEEAPPSGPMSPESWDALLATLREASPLQAGSIGNTLFISDDEGLVTVAIHPEDTDSRDALLGETLSELIAEHAPRLCGHSITLRLVTDESVAPPVAEEPPPPAPLPMPAPRPAAPRPKAPEKKPEPEKPAAPPSLKPSDEEFYKDPLIELALKEFHATLIK